MTIKTATVPVPIDIACLYEDGAFLEALERKLRAFGYKRRKANALQNVIRLSNGPDADERVGARVVILGETAWREPPFDVSQAEGAVAPDCLIVRTKAVPVPEFLYPLIADSSADATATFQVDVFRNTDRGVEAVLQALGLKPRPDPLSLAEAILVGAAASPKIIVNLAGRGVTPTAKALRSVDRRLSPAAASAIEAVFRGDPAALREALGADPGVIGLRFAADIDLLQLACLAPVGEGCVKVLVDEAAASMDSLSLTGQTPAMMAVWNNPAAFHTLAKRGADLRRVSHLGATILTYAAWRGEANIVKTVLNAGCDPRLTDLQMQFPLSWAVAADRSDVVERFLDHDPNLASLRAGDYGIGSGDLAFSLDDASVDPYIRWVRRRAAQAPERGRTALHTAAWAGRLDACRRLLQAGGDPNARDSLGVVPLQVACDGNSAASPEEQADLAGVLIQAGADPDHTDSLGITPFMTSIFFEQEAVANQLAAVVKAPNMVNEDGRSAAHFAATAANDRLLDIVADAGADLDLEDLGGFRPINLAVRFAGVAQVQGLARHIDLSKADSRGRVPFFNALNPEIAEWEKKAGIFLDAGVDINRADERGLTALTLVCSQGQLEVAEFLLRRGADPNLANRQNVPPLHVAISRGNFALARALLARGARIDAVDAKGETALGLAVRAGRDDAIAFLLEAGADPWAAEGPGHSAAVIAGGLGAVSAGSQILARLEVSQASRDRALQAALCAAGIDNHEMIAKLRRAGFSLDLSLEDVPRPLALAAMHGNARVVQTLISLGAEVNWPPGTVSALGSACQSGKVAVVQSLLDAGASPNQPGMSGLTPMHIAAHQGDLEIISALRAVGAFPEPYSHRGATPLHLAAMKGAPDVVSLLLLAKATVSPLDEDGDTPLHFAAAGDAADAVARLIEGGAAVDAVNKAGETPLATAAKLGALAAVKALLKAGANPKHGVVSTGLTIVQMAANNHREVVVQTLLAAGAGPPGPSLSVSTQASFLDWEPMDEVNRAAFMAHAADILAQNAIDQPEVEIRRARVTFLPRVVVVAVADQALSAPNEYFFLWSASDQRVLIMDWTNAPLYAANDAFGWQAGSSAAAIEYVRFFLFFVRGEFGRFNVVESGSELPWLPSAEPDPKTEAMIEPIRLIESRKDGAITLELTCVFKTSLFRTQCHLAPKAGEYSFDGEPPDFRGRGELTLANEELLASDLPFAVVGPPGRFG